MPTRHYDPIWTFKYTNWCYDVFKWRIEAGKDQHQFATMLGYSQSTVAKIELYQWVSLPTIIVVSSCLGLDLAHYVRH